MTATLTREAQDPRMEVAEQATVFGDLRSYITRYVAFPNECQADVVTMWVLHTWAFQTAKTTPYLYVHSPEKQSGKSRLIEVLTSIVRNPLGAIDMTGPVLFRAIDQLRPTVLLDEVDAIWSGRANEGLRGIINGGYKLGGHVWRLAGSEPVKFNTFCPKLLAGIHNGHLPDTIVDRCIPLTLRRKKIGQEVDPFYVFENEAEVEAMLVKVDKWVEAHAESLAAYKQHAIEGLSDRESEILWPLLAIANEFGMVQTISTAVAEMIHEFHVMTTATDKALELVRGIAVLFESFGRRKLHTEEVLAGMKMGENQGKLLSVYLDQYSIDPKNIRIGTRVAKGYTYEQFDELFQMHGIKVDLV